MNYYKLKENLLLDSNVIDLYFNKKENFWNIIYIKNDKKFIIKSNFISICSGICSSNKKLYINNENMFSGKIIHPKEINNTYNFYFLFYIIT